MKENQIKFELDAFFKEGPFLSSGMFLFFLYIFLYFFCVCRCICFFVFLEYTSFPWMKENQIKFE